MCQRSTIDGCQQLKAFGNDLAHFGLLASTVSATALGDGDTITDSRLRLRYYATQVDVDAFLLTHRGTWDRLDQLVKKRRSLTGAEIDELVELYQRVSTHLSMLRSVSSDSLLVGRLSSLVAARGPRSPARMRR